MAIAFVQKSSLAFNFGVNVSPSLTGTTAGNFAVLCVVYYCQPAGTPSAPAGWSTAVAPAPLSPVFGGDASGVAIYYLENIPGGTLTATPSASNGVLLEALIAEFSGVKTSSSIDQVANSQSVVGTNSRVSGTTAALAASNDLAVAVVQQNAAPGVTNCAMLDPPSGFISLGVDNNSNAQTGMEFCYSILSSAAGASTTWTWTDAGTAASEGAIATFQATGGGGGNNATISWVS